MMTPTSTSDNTGATLGSPKISANYDSPGNTTTSDPVAPEITESSNNADKQVDDLTAFIDFHLTSSTSPHPSHSTEIKPSPDLW